MRNKGFTLIELLVVIAIIGILAALVLVALGNARDKANDARIKSSISQLRTLAEVIYDSGGASYNNTGAGGAVTVAGCFVTPTDGECGDPSGSVTRSVNALLADIADANPVAVVATDSAAAFCVQAALINTNEICVDSTGITTDRAPAVGECVAGAC